MPAQECNEDCNHCQVIHSPNWKKGYLILARLVARLERKYVSVLREVNKHCPNMTCCPECHLDDFTHFEGCSIGKMLDMEENL